MTALQKFTLHSKSPESLAELLNLWLQDGQYREILSISEALDDLPTMPRGELLRVLFHFHAMAYIYMGAPQKAKLYYLKAKEYGDNVALTQDLACCYYLLDEIDEWRTTYKDLESILEQAEFSISSQQRWRAQLILGKFYEEEGQIHKAKEYYESTLRDTLAIGEKNLSLQALPQVLRIHALFTSSERISELYTKLMDTDASRIPFDLSIEIEHSLMLAELYLIGPIHAWTRVEAAFQSKTWSEDDLRLILFDYAEEVMLRQKALPEGIHSYISETWTLTAHEEQIYKFMTTPDAVEINWLNRLSPRLSAACRLRGLFLFLANRHNEHLQKETHRKIQLLLGVLPVEARSFWLQKIEPFFEKTDLTISVDPKLKKLVYQNKELDLSRKKGMLQIMDELGNQPYLSIDSLIDHLWNCDYSPEHFHRLRMTVHRLNNLLFDLTSIQKVVEFDSEQVKIHPSINISKVTH